MTNDNKPVRGISTIQRELDDQLNDNTYKNAFKTLGLTIVFTVVAYIGYHFANTIYVWLWILTGIGWIASIGMLVFGKRIEAERQQKIAELQAELEQARHPGKAAASASTPSVKSASTPSVKSASAPSVKSTPTPSPAPAPVRYTATRPSTATPATPAATAPASAAPAPASAERPRFCGHCGQPVDATTKFCGHCGQAV